MRSSPPRRPSRPGEGLRLVGAGAASIPPCGIHLPVLVGKLARLRTATASRSTWRSPPTAPPCGRGRRPGGGRLRRVNISLDTLRQDRFLELTRRDELARVLDGIEAATRGGPPPGEGQRRRHPGRERRRGRGPRRLRPRGRRDRALHRVDAARRRRHLAIGPRWCRQAEIVAAIDAVFRSRAADRRGTAPAERFAYRDGPARSASSIWSPGRSAAPATASASPPTASSAPACSPLDEDDLRALLRRRVDRRRAGRRHRGTASGASGPASQIGG